MRITSQSGMNIFELLFAVFYVACGTAAALWATPRFGWLVGIGAFVVVVPAVHGVFHLFSFLERMCWYGIPSFPTCRTSKCHDVDYKYQPTGDGQYGLFCKCCSRYKKQGRRFFEVLPDGSLRPYMIWRSFRGWFPDSL